MLIHSDKECTFEHGYKLESANNVSRNILIGALVNVPLGNTHSPAAEKKAPEHQRYIVNLVLKPNRWGRNFTLSL